MEVECYGCWQEARRCDRVATELLRIRHSTELWTPVSVLLREVEMTSRLLRDLHDLFPIYRSRISIVVYYLTVILPCLQKTLRDMMIYIDHEAIPAPTQWELLNERLNDQGGMGLAPRFIMYIEFLVQLVRLLSRSPLYDPTALELLRMQILRLRLLRQIPAPPVPVEPHFASPSRNPNEIERRHWAEKIFDHPPNSATGLKHKRGSRCFGPPMVEEQLGIPPGSTVLFKQSFDKNRLSVTLYLHADGADVTRVLCRWMDPYFNPQYSSYGVHELCVRRKGSSLQFRRWRNHKAHSTLWMALFFKTFEKMVLFHAAFVALKSRCPLTINGHPEDYKLAGEKMLFQGPIVDDGFEHTLAVYQDKKCHVIRLHAAVRSGELKKCPVWSAFVSHESEKPEWIDRRSAHRMWLKKLQPFVFCENYKKRRQIQKRGEYEIYFVNKKDADDFEALFREDDVDSIIDVNGIPSAEHH